MHNKLGNDMILAASVDANNFGRSTDTANPWHHETAIAHKSLIQVGMRVDCVNMFGNLHGAVKVLEKGSVIVFLDSGVDGRFSYWDIYPIT
jgi:hypothetical protein